MTRGFMGLLSESEDHLDDAKGRIRGERVALSGIGESAPLVEAQGTVVAFGDPQLEPLQLAKARPVDDRAQERFPCAPAPPFGFHPHAAYVAGRRMLPVEEAEDQPEGEPVLLGEEHGLAAGHGHRLREANPVRVGLPSLVDEAAREGVGRLGEGAESQLPEEFPFASLELADPHAGGTPLLRRREEKRLEGERPAIEPPRALAPPHALKLASGAELTSEESPVEHGPHYTDDVQGMKDDGAMARASFDFRARLRVVRELRTACPSPPASLRPK